MEIENVDDGTPRLKGRMCLGCGRQLTDACVLHGVQIGMPVVTTTVLAIGARELANDKAIVSRCATQLCGVCFTQPLSPCHMWHPSAA